MNKNLKQKLGEILGTGSNREAALVMGRRYLSEETLCWAEGANYECIDSDYDVQRFIEAWHTNTDYEIVVDSAFEGNADIAVSRNKLMDCVKVTLYGVTGEDSEPAGLYVALLRHVSDWIEKNADAVRNREQARCLLGTGEECGGGQNAKKS